jgi:dihydrofolate reductase
MGRKTWESIPPRFRPLKDRNNVVISRSSNGFDHAITVASMDVALNVISSTVLDRRAFVIGGAQIYKEALEKAETKRILLTRVLTDVECDTFFPVKLNEDGTADGWTRKTKDELDSWVGESVPQGVQEENGTRYIFEMWERA